LLIFSDLIFDSRVDPGIPSLAAALILTPRLSLQVAAAKLGIPGSTLESKIKSLKINKNRFKTTNPSADRN